MNIITFSELRKDLKNIMSSAADQHDIVIIKRPKGENMVLLSQQDYESLKETAYLLGTEANAKHLRKSIKSLKTKKIIKKNLIEE